MRRRRQVLQVSTFPFLAVLLCAMGSLILLLLVIDRRAKAVSRAKAEQAAARAVAEEAKLTADQQAARQAEWEQRRRQLLDLLAREEEEVVGRIKGVQSKTTAAAAAIQAEEARFHDLRLRLEAEAGQLVRTQEELRARRAEVAKASEKVDASRQELARLSGELERLEQTLRDLKALRERDKQTYSLIPYIGRHGDNRRPIYVECTAAGLVFHPDRFTLQGPSLSPMRIREEVERRIALQHESLPVAAHDATGKTEQSAYLLMLVRPDGIASYYRTQAALVGLKIDFGYEFVEADWILDFSADDNATAQQPWMTPANARTLAADRGAERAPLPRPVPAGVGMRGGFGGPGQQARQGAGPTSPWPANNAQQDQTGGNGFGPGPGGAPSGVPGTGAVGVGPALVPHQGGTGLGGPLLGSTGEPANDQRPTLLKPMTVTGKVGIRSGDNGTGLPVVGDLTGQTGSVLPPPQVGASGNAAPEGTGGPTGQPATDGEKWFAPRRGSGPPSGFAGLGSAHGIGDRTESGPDAGAFGMGASGTTQGTGDSLRIGVGPPGNGAEISGTAPSSRDGSAASWTPPSRAPDSTAGQSGNSYGSPPGTGTGSDVSGTAPGSRDGSAASGTAPSRAPDPNAGPGGNGNGSPPGTGTGSDVSRTAPGSRDGSAASGTAPSRAPDPNAGPGGNGSGPAPGSSGLASGPSEGGTGAGQRQDSNASGPPSTGVGGSPRSKGQDEPGGEPGMPIPPILGGYGPTTKPTRPPLLPLSRLLGNRDWPILVECQAEMVVVRALGLRVPVASLEGADQEQGRIVAAVQKLIADRQATLRPGEPPYRPVIRFLVHPEGLRAYYLVYPRLEALKLPMTRENVEPPPRAPRTIDR